MLISVPVTRFQSRVAAAGYERAASLGLTLHGHEHARKRMHAHDTTTTDAPKRLSLPAYVVPGSGAPKSVQSELLKSYSRMKEMPIPELRRGVLARTAHSGVLGLEVNPDCSSDRCGMSFRWR